MKEHKFHLQAPTAARPNDTNCKFTAKLQLISFIQRV